MRALWLSGAMWLASAPAAASGWAVTLPWHVKVRPGAALEGSSAAALSAARGECEGFQVLVRPPAADVDAQPLALKGPGAKLSVRLYREEFIEVRTPSNSQGAPGLWPDPLIPVEDPHHGEGRRALPASSLPERPLVLYAEACVPAEQSPGTYRGKLSLRAKGLPPLELPVQLQVQPFTLPATSSLPNSFGVSIYSLSRGHHVSPESGEAKRLLRDYGAALLMHRLSPHGMSMRPPSVRAGKGELSVDFAEYDEEMAPFLDGKALPSGARVSTAEVREPPRSLDERERVAYYRRVREHFADRGWKAQLFYYAKDEPKPDDVPLVLAQSSRVRSAGSIPVLITAPLDSALGAAADILCPTLNCFFPRPGPQTCRNVQTLAALREQLGPRKKVWWYQSCNVHGCTGGPAADPKIEQVYSGWASYMLDHPATLNRAMGPLAFLAGIDGELYFDTVYAYNTKKDPWADVFEFGGNGDGTLFYPGTPDRIGGKTHIPIESLRLKHIRDGLEDFEYLTLLARLDPAAARKSVEKLVRSGYEVTRDPGVWDAVRAAMTTALAVPVKPDR